MESCDEVLQKQLGPLRFQDSFISCKESGKELKYFLKLILEKSFVEKFFSNSHPKS